MLKPFSRRSISVILALCLIVSVVTIGTVNSSANTNMMTLTGAANGESHTHAYSNGICTRCGQYETPVLNNNGEYELKNAGNFLWFAALVNNETEHADFEARDTAAKAVMTEDIDLENRTFTNIGLFDNAKIAKPEDRFTGSFDGQGHTLSNFYADGAFNHRGVFGSISEASIIDLTVKGRIDASETETDSDTLLGFICDAGVSNVICDITSYIDVTCGDNGSGQTAAGIVCLAAAGTTISRCVNCGNITLSGENASAGSINNVISSAVVIEDCANLGAFTVPYGQASGVTVTVEDDNNEIKNCYNCGDIMGKDEDNASALTISASNRNTVENCYRLEGTAPEKVFSDNVTEMTADQFQSGEVGYKLNSGVTDGTQSWYQNIDNGKTPDDVPLPDKNHGTIYYIESENRYSNYPDGVVPETPTTAPTEAPTQPPAEPEPPHGIRTYEELVAFANSVNNGDNTADTYLENNILAPEDSQWTPGIGTAESPYNGTFDGKGYCVIGLNLYNIDHAGLFGNIGKDGVVKDLMVFDCRSAVSAQYAGGIAAVNEGVIDHCSSGITLSGSAAITLPSGDKIDPSAYNSYLFGTCCGGVAAVNKGEITGTRSGTAVEAVYSGGIAAINEGTIYGCANNGAVGSASANCKQSGGLAGENKGKIYSSYNSGIPSCGDSTAQGMIAGVNSSDTIKDVFYNDINSISPVGSSSSAALSDAAGLKKISDMKTDKFVDTLNSVTDNTVTWVPTRFKDSYCCQGCPTILGNCLQERQAKLIYNMTISGLMHSDLLISAVVLPEESDEFRTLEAAVDGYVTEAYSVCTTDFDDNYVPAQLWTAGGVQLTLFYDEDDEMWYYVLLAIGEDGKVFTITPDRYDEEGITFTMAYPMTFALAAVPELPVKYLLGDADGNGEIEITDVTVIQRFDIMMSIGDLTEEDLLERTDVDSDEQITIIDATLIQRYLAGMKVKYPIGEDPLFIN